MTTYRELFASREFRAIFASNVAIVAAMTMQMLALSTLVYLATDSPLLAALAYLGGYLPQALGAMTLLSFADRVRPKGFLVGWSVARTLTAAVFATGVLPIWAILALIMAFGAVDSLAGGVRNAVLADILAEGYVLARSTLNVSVGAMQILAFATGGTAIALLGPAQALTVSAVLLAASALVTWTGLRPRTVRAQGQAGLRATWQGNRALMTDPRTRAILFGLWLPAGLIVGAEAMYVPYAAGSASVLFIAAALGMLAGDVLIGRWAEPARRAKMVNSLHTLLALPYLIFFAHPPLWLCTVAVAVASFGFAGSLGLQQRLVEVVPERLRGQAFGLAGSGTMSMQAVGAALVGSTAEITGAAGAMTIAAVGSLTVTAILWRRLRASQTAEIPWMSN
jgi:hypothetical protein